MAQILSGGNLTIVLPIPDFFFLIFIFHFEHLHFVIVISDPVAVHSQAQVSRDVKNVLLLNVCGSR